MQKLPTLLDPAIFHGVRIAQSLVFCVVFYRLLFVRLASVLLILPRYTDSDDLFGIFNFFVPHFSTDVFCIRRLALHQYKLYHLARFCLFYNNLFFHVLTNTTLWLRNIEQPYNHVPLVYSVSKC